MTDETKLIAGILLMAVTTIEFGGTFLLQVLSGKHSEFTSFSAGCSNGSPRDASRRRSWT
jgi:hypothetical protein